MVITGANAGGKTISIKTIGILFLMALSGMPVPADSSSSFPLTMNLLADIGDEQSIEDNLSTFSAHITNISDILKKTDPETVVLIDELGTGTDPEEGAALACAILQDLQRSGAVVFATTHLADIKGFVHRTRGMMNASMEFDQKTLTPLYKLRTGEPGQSHAIETARKYGLPENVLKDAKGMLGSMKIELDNMIADLNEKRLHYEDMLKDFQIRQTELEQKTVLLDLTISETEGKKKETLSKAYKEASEIISDAKRQMHALLEEIKNKDKELIRKTIKQAETRQEHITEKIREYDVEDLGGPLIDNIKKGDPVFVRSLGYDAIVVDVNHKK